MKRKVRRETTRTSGTHVAQVRSSDVREALVARGSAWLTAGSVALIVATPLIPSEAAVLHGSHVVLIMAWVILTSALLGQALLQKKTCWHVGPTAAVLALFLALHTLSAMVMMRYGHGRPTLNSLWLWISFGLTFLCVRQLFRSSVQQRALLATCIALAVGFAGFGIYQTTVAYPQQRAAYRQNPEEFLRDAGIAAPVGSPERRHFEARLESTEPMGPFALTNSLAGFLVPNLMLLLGLARSIGLAWFKRPPNVRALMSVALLLAGVMLTVCLIMTKSRAAYLAAIIGVVLWGAHSARSWRRVDRKWLFAGGLGLLLVVASVVAWGGLDRQVLTEATKSLQYRFEYWQAAAKLSRDYPWWGCGPGNFRDYFTHYKVAGASEEVADPHNFLMEIAATTGLPATLVFLLVIAVFAWHAWHQCDDDISEGGARASPAHEQKTVGIGGPRSTSIPVVAGAVAGILLAYPAGWAGGQSPWFDMLWVVLPLVVLTLWLLRSWIESGSLPRWPLVLGLIVLMVNLCAAGGIGFPGIAMLLAVLSALVLNLGEQGGAGRFESDGNANESGVRNRAVVTAALACCLIAGGFCYVTFYRPVLAGHEFAAFVADVRRSRSSREQLIRRSLQAAETDRWWAQPYEVCGNVLQQHWLDSADDASLAEFHRVARELIARNPQAAGVARLHGDWLLEMYTHRADRSLLKQAVAAYRRAVSLYPNSNLYHAQLAWAYFLADDLSGAIAEAEEALRLDDLLNHDELKLRAQQLCGRSAVPAGGGVSPLNWGDDPEQLMRELRKLGRPS